ncbi:hypothetical protein R3P38DRAFT_2571105, partial [Favolaschia claudopus]
EQDVDVAIVDASVLVHALRQVKRSCRDGREEARDYALKVCLKHYSRIGNDISYLTLTMSLLTQRAPASSKPRLAPICGRRLREVTL